MQWGLPQPEYLNLIRHPLERIVQNVRIDCHVTRGALIVVV